MTRKPRVCRGVALLASAALGLLVVASVAGGQAGGEFDLTWNTIAAGGGMSTDGDFTVNGSAGQPDAATLTDGDYTVSGGFWAGVSTGASGPCIGDCGGDGSVTVDELIIGVNIALGNTTVDHCAVFDANSNNQVTIDELIQGVNNALNGCS